MEREKPFDAGRSDDAKYRTHSNRNDGDRRLGQQYQNQLNANPPQIHGYRPTCTCGADSDVPGTVLDPFCGSGTCLSVAQELGLNGIGLDLSVDYLDQHVKPRIGLTPSSALDDLPLFQLDVRSDVRSGS